MMRNMIAILFIFCSISVFSENLIVIKDANLRSEPNTESTIIRITKSGEELKGTSYDENWYEITNSDGAKYYIHKSLVNIAESKTANDEEVKDDFEIPPIIIITIVVILLIMMYGFRRRCPKCKKWFARRITNTQTIDRKQYYKTVVREDIHKNSKGEEIGRTKRNEQVHMIKDTDRVYCECKKCGYQWTYLSISEREG